MATIFASQSLLVENISKFSYCLAYLVIKGKLSSFLVQSHESFLVEVRVFVPSQHRKRDCHPAWVVSARSAVFTMARSA